MSCQGKNSAQLWPAANAYTHFADRSSLKPWLRCCKRMGKKVQISLLINEKPNQMFHTLTAQKTTSAQTAKEFLTVQNPVSHSSQHRKPEIFCYVTCILFLSHLLQRGVHLPLLHRSGRGEWREFLPNTSRAVSDQKPEWRGAGACWYTCYMWIGQVLRLQKSTAESASGTDKEQLVTEAATPCPYRARETCSRDGSLLPPKLPKTIRPSPLSLLILPDRRCISRAGPYIQIEQRKGVKVEAQQDHAERGVSSETVSHSGQMVPEVTVSKPQPHSWILLSQ